MTNRRWQVMGSIIVALVMTGAILLGAQASGGPETWRTTTFGDFVPGTLNGVDVWSAPGNVQLDHQWSNNIKINDPAVLDNERLSLALSFALDTSGPMTKTIFLAVWADERVVDHEPDIYFSSSNDGGATWSADTMVNTAHSTDALEEPDIAVRSTDGMLFVVWQNDTDGNLYYAISSDQGLTWSMVGDVIPRTGGQKMPALTPHGPSGTLYVAWEDETDDDGDIYAGGFFTTTWSSPVLISNDRSGAEQRNPAITADVEGNVYAVWEDTRSNTNGEIYFSRWLTGTTWSTDPWIGENKRLSADGICGATAPDIVAGSGDRLYATWVEQIATGLSCSTKDYQVVVARSDDQGETWSSTVVKRLYDASGGGAISDYRDPSLGTNRQGEVYVAWTHLPDQTQFAKANVLFSLSPDRGDHWTTPRALSTQQTVASDEAPSLVADFRSNVVVAWNDYRETHRHIYSSHYPMLQHRLNGTYTSPVLDAGGPAAWDAISWTVTTPPGTGVQIATCTPTNTTTACTNWTSHTTPGESLSMASGRYIQYRAVLTKEVAVPHTPRLEEVIITYEQYEVFLPLVLRN